MDVQNSSTSDHFKEQEPQEPQKDPGETEELQEASTEVDPPNVEYTLVTRAGWGAQEAKGELKPLNHPVKNVLLAFNTGVAACLTKDECKERMRELQQRHLDLGLPDLHYNFTVGGDGNLYEGRGWDYQPELFKERPEFDESSICIGVLGDANDMDTSNPFEPLIHAAYLALLGEEQGYVQEEYFTAEDTQTFGS